MHIGGDPRWPVLDGGPAPVPLGEGHPWVHDGYRMHVAGRGVKLETVRAGAVLLDAIEHDRGDRVTLHADRVESHRGGEAYHRWATALELPLFVWERAGAGEVSWVTPLTDTVVEPSADGTRLTLSARATNERLVFAAHSGAVRVAGNGRMSWNSQGADRLVVLAAAGDADLERSLDLVTRRTIGGLGRQRVQHAEQLHRGGAAMRSAGIPALADAFDWAKIRGDALLGGLLEGTIAGEDASAAQALLAGGLLAAGLSHLPRALRRRHAAGAMAGSGVSAAQLAAWTGDAGIGADATVPIEAPHSGPGQSDDGDIGEVRAHDIAAGQVAAPGVASILSRSIGGIWGVVPDAPRGLVTLAPDPAVLGGSAALSRLRIGRTVLDVRVRSRGELVSVGVRRGSGPPIVMDCTLRGATVAEMLVDGEAVGGTRSRFEVRDAHDVQFHLGG